MYACPRCHHDLVPRTGEQGVSWHCGACGGQAMAFGVLRRSIGEQRLAEIRGQMLKKAGRDGCICPMCSLPMTTVGTKVQGREITLDLCQPCGFVWFDANEFETFPAAPPKPHVLGEIDPAKLTLEMREKLALIEVKEIAEQARTDNPLPDEGWKGVPAILGLPVEMDSPVAERTPWATYLLSLVVAVVSLAAFSNLDPIVKTYGLIPDQAWRYGGLTLLTDFFLHVGLIHLIGNLYFLVIFGRTVEQDLGPWRWLLLILAATLTGNLLHIWGDPRGDIPCIGASGGISGVLVYYALKFPQLRLGIFFRFSFFYWRWVQFPAWVAFLLWMALQIIGAFQQHYGMSSVSSLAHLGGVAAGVAFWMVWRNREPTPEPFRSADPLEVKIR